MCGFVVFYILSSGKTSSSREAEVIRYETCLLRFLQNYFYTLIAHLTLDKLTLGEMHVNTHRTYAHGKKKRLSINVKKKKSNMIKLVLSKD